MDHKVSKCMELVQKFCPERRKLRIREALSKKNPLFDKERTSKGYLLCSECDIKSFIYPGSLRNHLQRQCKINHEELEFFMKKSTLITGGISIPNIELIPIKEGEIMFWRK